MRGVRERKNNLVVRFLKVEPAGGDKSGEEVEPKKPNAEEEEEDGGVRL